MVHNFILLHITWHSFQRLLYVEAAHKIGVKVSHIKIMLETL